MIHWGWRYTQHMDVYPPKNGGENGLDLKPTSQNRCWTVMRWHKWIDGSFGKAKNARKMPCFLSCVWIVPALKSSEIFKTLACLAGVSGLARGSPLQNSQKHAWKSGKNAKHLFWTLESRSGWGLEKTLATPNSAIDQLFLIASLCQTLWMSPKSCVTFSSIALIVNVWFLR